MPLQLEDLAALDAPLQTAGVPLMLPIDSIDEDPQQPRREFDVATLEELAQTIRTRGVRQPISVRPSSTEAGRWVLNLGARRLRASRLAGATEVPVFVDTTADSYDQLIENEQREGLKPLEIALFVQRRLAAGETQADVARRLGKSRQYVTYATALIEAPAWLLQLYREGRCQGIVELYELRKLQGEHGAKVERWCAGRDPITRRSVANLKAELVGDPQAANIARGSSDRPPRLPPAAPPTTMVALASQGPTACPRHGSPVLLVEVDGAPHSLITSVVPDREGHVFVQLPSGGTRRLVSAAEVTLLGFAKE